MDWQFSSYHWSRVRCSAWNSEHEECEGAAPTGYDDALLHLCRWSTNGIIIVFPYLEDNPLFFSTDSQYGAFGWITDINLILYLDGFIVPFTGIAANVAFIYCYVYWPIEVICIAALFEPFIAQFAGIMLGQDEIPGTRTLFGLLIISVGVVIASYGAKMKMISKIKSLLDENLN